GIATHARLARCAAGCAPSRRMHQPTTRVKLLLPGREDELGSAVFTLENPILIGRNQRTTSSGLVRNAGTDSVTEHRGDLPSGDERTSCLAEAVFLARDRRGAPRGSIRHVRQIDKR